MRNVYRYEEPSHRFYTATKVKLLQRSSLNLNKILYFCEKVLLNKSLKAKNIFLVLSSGFKVCFHVDKTVIRSLQRLIIH